MFGNRRAKRAIQQVLAGMAEQAKDPRRQIMAEVVEVVLRSAGFAQAEIDTSNDDGYALPSSRGFWMRVDSIGPGIYLTYTGSYPRECQEMARCYKLVLQRAFQPVLGSDVGLYVVLVTDIEWHRLSILLPPNWQLRQLHEQLVRR